ncbi:MAG: nickel-dependent lactate racemase [Planctomycetota bacterium]|jgi:nickel-dependent lactate racemase|nr:nickel-dependent lactate racemase [Planctomycetota bacterium]
MKRIYALTSSGGKTCYRDSTEGVELLVPEGIEVASLSVVDEPEAPALEKLISPALAQPLGSVPLAKLANGKKTAAIIVSDATRAVATASILPHLMAELAQGGIEAEGVSLVVGLGVHRPATPEEMREICGPLAGKVAIYNHDPHANLVELGTTRGGTPVSVNRRVWEADIHLSIGKVETHEFAGYSGGRKSVLPGISSEATIEYNHRPEMIANPLAVPGCLAGNPIHEDMLEAARLLRLDFTVNLVQNAKGEPLAVFAGELEQSHAAAVDYYQKSYGVKIDPGVNIYLTTPGFPLNIDLYQSMKPFFGLYPVLKKGDVVILYSGCGEGVNSSDMLEPFTHGPDLAAITDFLRENYRIQMDHSLLFCKLLQKGVRVIGVSEKVAAADFSLMQMTPAGSLGEALEIARDLKLADGSPPRLGVVPMAQRLIITGA